ncbi:MAG: hypothetical protein J5733_06565, partial [Bacteroidaceae bacterium]|nr:hypothetical protein [Bacteroidaceae bacterium]
MKRKITSFAVLLLSLLLAAPVLANELSLIGTGAIVTTPYVDNLYVIQGNGQAGQISWLYDNGGTTLAATEASEVPTGSENLKYVWVFESTKSGFAAKNYATGRYIFIEGTSNGGSVKMQDTPAYFTIEVDGDNVGFKNASGQYIDMSYSGVKSSTWAGGVSGSRILNIYVAEVEEVSDLTAAIGRLTACFEQYEQYLPDYGEHPFERGTEIGQYNCSDEDYNLFVNNLALALAILQEEVEDVTVEMIDQVISNIEAGYNAIVASLVVLTIA